MKGMKFVQMLRVMRISYVKLSVFSTRNTIIQVTFLLYNFTIIYYSKKGSMKILLERSILNVRR